MRESIWMIVLFFFTLNAYSAEISSCPPIEKEKNTIAISQPVFEQFRLCKNAEQMELHAHRGAGNRPENTMAAFKEAVKQGASVIELDLQMSADKTVIINHDPELRENQCLNPDGSKQQKKNYVWKMNFAEIQKFDCGSLVSSGQKPVPGEKILSLTEGLDFLKDHENLKFNIEIKYRPDLDASLRPPLEEYLDKVIETIEKSRIDPSRFFIQSFQHDALAYIKKKKPEWEISPLLGTVENILTIPYELNAETVTPHFKGLTKEIVTKLHQDGKRVIPWTANTHEEMMQLIELGVDGIITDQIPLFQKTKEELCGSALP